MKVLLLAGGLGTRLSEEINLRPKPMVGIGRLPKTDKIMNDAFWIGLYPGMGDEAIAYMVEKIRDFVMSK